MARPGPDRKEGPTALGRYLNEQRISIDGLVRRIRDQSGDRLNPDASLAWRWVNAETRPRPRYLEAIASVLHVDSGLLRSQIEADYNERRRPAAAGEVTAFSEEAFGLSPRGNLHADVAALREAQQMMDRRRLLESILLGVAAGPIMALANATRASRLSPGALDGLSLMTEHLGRNFDRYDYGELTRQLGLELDFVTRYLQEPTTVSQRTELCRQGARLAALSGFVAFLTGRIDRAFLCYDTAFRLADEIGERTMMAWVVSEEASMACYVGDVDKAARMMLRMPAINSPSQQANSSSNAARALARLGDRPLALKAISETERWALQISPDDDSSLSGPMWSFSQISGFTRIGESWLRLGEPALAIEYSDRALELGKVRENPRFVAHARLINAAAYASSGSPEHACAVASDVFGLFPQDFYTIASRTQDLFATLERYADCADVLRLKEEFGHYMKRSGTRSMAELSAAGPAEEQ